MPRCTICNKSTDTDPQNRGLRMNLLKDGTYECSECEEAVNEYLWELYDPDIGDSEEPSPTESRSGT